MVTVRLEMEKQSQLWCQACKNNTDNFRQEDPTGASEAFQKDDGEGMTIEEQAKILIIVYECKSKS
jgi:hypothetical protein